MKTGKFILDYLSFKHSFFPTVPLFYFSIEIRYQIFVAWAVAPRIERHQLEVCHPVSISTLLDISMYILERFVLHFENYIIIVGLWGININASSLATQFQYKHFHTFVFKNKTIYFYQLRQELQCLSWSITYPAATFSDFSNSSDSKVKVKVKGPNMCYIFEKHGIQGYRI